MKYIKVFESIDDLLINTHSKRQLVDFDEKLETLKDALSELCDKKTTTFSGSAFGYQYIKIWITLEYHYDESLSGFRDISELKRKQKDLDEKMEILNLVEEGLVRSQLDYKTMEYNVGKSMRGDHGHDNNMIFLINL